MKAMYSNVTIHLLEIHRHWVKCISIYNNNEGSSIKRILKYFYIHFYIFTDINMISSDFFVKVFIIRFGFFTYRRPIKYHKENQKEN